MKERILDNLGTWEVSSRSVGRSSGNFR